MIKITAHRALSELKTLVTQKGNGYDNPRAGRIEKSISDAIFCVANKQSNNKISGMTIEEYKNKVIIASYDTVVGLIKRYNSLKVALVMSNAGLDTETIDMNSLKRHMIAGEEMTVAQIIERKNSIKFDKMLLESLKNHYRAQVSLMNKENDNMPQKVERYLSSSGFGSRDNSNADELAKIESTFKENQTFVLIDPLNIVQKINDLEEKITNFEIEVDSLLSEVNATTMIQVG